MPKGKPMTPSAAARIQGAEAKAHGGKVGSDTFAARAQRAAAGNAPTPKAGGKGGGGGKKK
ncbi:MAG TPA: hypothetical protein VLK84_31570 [Longimicrobium sp.]|nr:hypothetical protein [Longimicrobium sp.]